jgi:hypothetical protein
MEKEQIYTSVKATYRLENGILGGPKDVSFQTNYNGIIYVLRIYQQGIRVISVSTEKPVNWAELLGPLYCLERLLMVFDGTFIPLTDIEFLGSPYGDNGKIVKTQAIKQRLSYFKTDNHYFTIKDKLVDFRDVLDIHLFVQWQKLLEELDIVNQVYLYSTAKTGITVDIRLAFLIEMAEPLIEILNAKKKLDSKKKKFHLKECIKVLINTYGNVIFAKERQRQSNCDTFLNTLVNSRVRIMHIKRNQEKDYFDDKHCVAYMRKMSLMYRIILLELLDVPYENYENRLIKIVESIDRWMINNF